MIDQGAHLAAALCKYYKLGRPVFGQNIRDHRETGSTSCPYHLAAGGRYHQQWMDRAQYWYDQMTRTSSPTKKEETMNAEERAALNDAKIAAQQSRDMVKLVLDQIAGPKDFTGWPQGGGRTLYDLTSAIAEVEGVPGTRDTKEG